MTKTYTNSAWTTCGRQLLQNGKTFFIRGVNYAPTPIGEPGRLDMLGHEEIYTRDLKNLRDMNANAVKTYDFYPWIDHIPYLDAAYNNGINPIHTIFSIWIDQSLMTPMVAIDSPQFKKTILQYYQMAKQTGGHPGTMGYSIGGEMNSITVIMDADFWNKFNALTSAVRRGLKENNNAQKIITTTFVDDGGETFRQGELHHADVDMWGSNVYQNDYPDFVIPAYTKSSKTKPLLVSEYGAPYSDDKGLGTEVELNVVADAIINQAVQMEKNFNLTDILKDQVIIGGFVFEYSDEWWKSGDLDEHNLGLTKNYVFPLGYLSEEYFGLYGASRPEDEKEIDKSTLDILSARPTVEKLKQLWSNQPLAGENVDGNCLVKVESLNVEQSAIANPPAMTNTIYNGVIGMIACMGIIVIALLAYRQKKRRALYQSI